MRNRWSFPAGFLVIVIAAAGYFAWTQGIFGSSTHEWTTDDLRTMRSLSIDSLAPLPPDPSNAVADDPRAAALGQAIFFDTRFSANGQFSCATCHQPDHYFTDGLPKAQAMGTTPRHTPTIVGVAYDPWFYWDGRRDSQWSQALTPMEAAVEQGGNRTRFAHIIAEYYPDEYEDIFGPLPTLDHLPQDAGPVIDPVTSAAWDGMSTADQDIVNRVFANIGKAIAAYERRIMPGRSRFDDYVAAAVAGDQARMADLFSNDEVAGLRLFLGKGNCTQCHNGPQFTNGSFHNNGIPAEEGQNFDLGRVEGVKQALENPFNCLGPYSDADPSDCAETRFAKTEGDELIGSFKTPTLRNVANTAPYMHKGTFADLDAVLNHYNAAPAAFPGHSDLTPLALSDNEMAQIKAFLYTLSADAEIRMNEE
ncbi:MAG: cytochrome c peroxidase [Caldilineaceae bacterium]